MEGGLWERIVLHVFSFQIMEASARSLTEKEASEKFAS